MTSVTGKRKRMKDISLVVIAISLATLAVVGVLELQNSDEAVCKKAVEYGKPHVRSLRDDPAAEVAHCILLRARSGNN